MSSPSGSPRRPLGRWWSRFRRRAEPEPRVGLVLSGGGASASFQIGALRYLYDKVGITPTVLTGTSAGSILAALLAQAGDHEGQRRVLADVERTYLRLQDPTDLMIELDWYAELLKLTPALQRAGTVRSPRLEPRTITLPALGFGRPGRGHGEGQEPVPGAVIKLPRWDPTPVRDALSVLWNVSRSHADFDALLHGVRRERSLYRPGPVFDWLLGPGTFDPDRVAASGNELRVAVVSLESGELRYVTGTGALVDREDQLIPGQQLVPLVDAVLASCAIPAVYPPVRLGAEHYVDGGTRENLPVEIAMNQLGVDRCYAINSLPQGLAPEASFADKDMLSILLRTTAGIMSDEVQLDGVSRAQAAGATIIAPEINLLGVLTVDPGLLSIATDYGYLRAAEACERASLEEQRLTREVIGLRRQIWALENDLLGLVAGKVPASSLAAVAAQKVQLRDLVWLLPQERLPEGADGWWRGWERHPFTVTERVSWVD